MLNAKRDTPRSYRECQKAPPANAVERQNDVDSWRDRLN
jgi:hypothetical protein